MVTSRMNLAKIRITPMLIEELITAGYLTVGDAPLDLDGVRVINIRYDYEPAPIGEIVATIEHDALMPHSRGTAIVEMPVQAR